MILGLAIGLLVGGASVYTFLRMRGKLVPKGVSADTVAAWQARK